MKILKTWSGQACLSIPVFLLSAAGPSELFGRLRAGAQAPAAFIRAILSGVKVLSQHAHPQRLPDDVKAARGFEFKF